jgi:signal transduction histidine kinase
VAVPTVISKAVESIEPHAVRKAIEIVTSVEEPLSPVFGHEGTLTEAVVNLGNNAVKYSHMGSKVWIKAAEENGQVVISISDTGVGIPEEDLPLIFEDCYRAKSGQAVAGGAGLGLGICRRIIETHGGSISARSEPGKGSTFVIRLPASKGDLQH